MNTKPHEPDDAPADERRSSEVPAAWSRRLWGRFLPERRQSTDHDADTERTP